MAVSGYAVFRALVNGHSQVVLGEVTGSAVLSTPATATVTIGANDDPSGVLSLKVDGVVTVNEDTPAASVTFVVMRGGGTFGSVSVGWEITRLDDDPAGDPAADLYPTSGVVTFVGDEREKTIVIGVVPDDLPEPVERFLLRLLGETVEGGARVEGVLETTLIIEDSDDAYGLVDFSPVAPSLITVTASSTQSSVILMSFVGDMRMSFVSLANPLGTAV